MREFPIAGSIVSWLLQQKRSLYMHACIHQCWVQHGQLAVMLLVCFSFACGACLQVVTSAPLCALVLKC
jgi:hypothetical protein